VGAVYVESPNTEFIKVDFPVEELPTKRTENSDPSSLLENELK
jgi:hypothetical protein